MKKKLLLLLLVAFLPITIFAKNYYDDYNTMNFKETVAAEELELANKDYKEDDKQAVIYLFRGQGCGFCHRFINYLNEISPEYGKYFRVVSFEVYYDKKNASLLNKVAAFNNENLNGGIPYAIIGEESFIGYSEEYNDAIKEAIMKEYNNPAEDLFKKIEKSEKGETGISSLGSLFWTFVFVAVGTTIVCIVSTKNKNEILEKINNLNSKNEALLKINSNKDEVKKEKQNKKDKEKEKK